MSAESSKIPQTPEALASYAQNYLRNHSTGLTEATAKLNDGNLSQPKDLTQQQRAEYVASGEHETIPYTYEQIKQNLENRVDISAELPPKLGELYRRALKYHTDQIETPNRRTYNQILRSIKNLVPTPDETTLGAFYPGGIGPEQRMAFNELKNDAIRFGKDIMQIIRRDPRLNEIQKAIYEEYNRSSQSPPPKPYMSLNNMGFDSEASLRGDFVIKRTKGEVDGTHRPEIYFNDWFAVASVDDLTPRAQLTNFQKVTRPESFQTLARKLLAAGQGDIVHAYRGVEQNLIKDRADYMKAIKRIRRQFSEEQQRAIGADMFLNEGSIDLLIESNVEPRPITAKELTVEAFVRGIFDDLFGRAQEVRSNTGRGPMDYVTHYITHMRATNLDEAFGIKTSIVEDTAALQNQRFANLKNTPFPMERTRRGGVFPAEMNVFDILENYVDYALRQIHLGPFVAKVHELIDTPIIDPTTGNTWRMSVEKPELYKVISEWNNHIAGKPEQSIPSPWNSILFSIGRSLGNSQIAGNISSIAIQPLGLLNTGQLYGYGRTIQATLGYMADLATPGHPKMKFRREHSKSLDVRNPDIYFDEAGAGVLENLLQQNRLTRRAGEAAQRASTYLGDVGTRGLRFTDQIAADISWDVGYDFALKAGKTGEAAFNIADDAVTLTQGSALRGERAPIQRKQWGRALTQFQTFAINNYDMITSQVLGIANKNMTNKQVVGNVLKFLGAGTILNFLMEDMGEGTSPLPNPPLAFTRTLLRGPEPNQSELSYLVELGLGSTLGEAAKIIPFASSLKVRGGQLGGPTAGFISSMGRALIGEEGTSLPRTVLRSLVPGGLQIDKMFFAPEKKNTQSFKSNRDDRPSLGGVR
jgi:hypothetical protein